MSRSTDSAASPREGSEQSAGYVCPFCGLAPTEERDREAPCPRCGISDTPATRKATKARIGPWHVRQMKNPWAPGMRWDTLMALVRRGQVTANSIVRGPTTYQLWRRARRVKGLSREFGICYSCGESIEKGANLCPHCNRLQEPPGNPDVLLETREMAGERASAGSPRPTAPIMRSTPAPVSLPQPESEQDDALLSARELATAFQLEFSPRDPRRRTGARTAVKVLVAVLLCGIIGALAYVRPEIGTSAWNWAQRQYQSVRGHKSSRLLKPAPVKTPEAIHASAKIPATEPSIKHKSAPELLTGPMPTPIVDPRRTEALGTAQPAKAIELPAMIAAPRGARSVGVSGKSAASMTAPLKPAPAPATAPSIDPVDEARMLWSAAIDAEANKDFVLAVKCYERIKKLPADAQPAGVDVRLEMARKRLR